MNNNDVDFSTWFEYLRNRVMELTGVEFRDQDSVFQDYEDGKDFDDVAEQISKEYSF